MMSKFHSIYSENPPCIIVEPPLPTEWVEETIRNKIDEEKFENSFTDLETVRVRELIKWEELKKPEMPLMITIMAF